MMKKKDSTLTPWLRHILLFGMDGGAPEKGPDDDPFVFWEPWEMRRLWSQHKDQILAEWRRLRREGQPYGAQFGG